MPTIPYKNKAQFARMCKVSKPAITQACERGAVYVSKNGKINPKHRINAPFMANRLAVAANDAREKAQVLPEPQPEPIPVLVEPTPVEIEPEPEPIPVEPEPKKRKPYKKRKKPVPEPSPMEPPGYGNPVTKMDVEIVRIQSQTTKINMEIAEKVGRFFLKEEVQNLFGRLATTFANLIHPLGQRLAPDICDICGITDSAIMIQVQNLIEHELEIAINEVKRLSADVNQR